MTEQRQHSGLYIHAPFCKSKCPYCDFYSITTQSLTDNWLTAVCTEALSYSSKYSSFDTLYIGGGTPSLLTAQQLDHILTHMRQLFHFKEQTEYTIEVNPDDISSSWLFEIISLGINRVSLGVQSTHDAELRFLGRRHTAQQAIKAIELCRAAGVKNMSVDLMYGFPLQTEANWLETLSRILDFKPEHLSCYLLTIEHGTPFAERQNHGELFTIDESKAAHLYLLTDEILREHGYIHYEISNYARDPQLISHHNNKYWKHCSYLGLGPAAHSYMARKRWWNMRSVSEYCDLLYTNHLPVESEEFLNNETFRLEQLMLGFRTIDGVSFDILQKTPNWKSICDRLVQERLIRMEAQRAIPTTLGFLVADRLPLLFI